MAKRRSRADNPPPSAPAESLTDIPQRQAESYISTYSNYVEIGTTPWDFRLRFFEVVEDEDGNPIREKKVSIVMSPQHTALLSTILRQTVDNWINAQQSDEGDTEPS